ncbi:hypothetical protein JQ582_18095 [Bradyrhizobium japonicum]|uniref:Uncharacterized protein n=1 Tax=Bradyrhizobium japonicum TaxID=375 RepID=A0ABV2RQG4_BRAJP|nr:hypothetical protein [Bradyrhizobium japonicum]MBR0745843.1 hypothetical protein [Bradyrhizobium japonicum]MBR0911880.1 hypothetical protein [Bradyrhizobium japonicum]UQD97424.1 hypothetical protein JEY30_39160 [Bradyrhizobium japonicum]WLB17551.1 hypothetical protein QIH95_37120 [Bradyrhizobium japonicum]
MTRAIAKYTAVIVRLDRTIQHAAADMEIPTLAITGCPAFAGHDKKE